MNNIKTELDFDKEKDNPEHTRHLSLMMFSGILIGFICGLAIVLTIINADLIDKIKPQTQLIILALTFTAFGVIRFVVWIRNL